MTDDKVSSDRYAAAVPFAALPVCTHGSLRRRLRVVRIVASDVSVLCNMRAPADRRAPSAWRRSLRLFFSASAAGRCAAPCWSRASHVHPLACSCAVQCSSAGAPLLRGDATAWAMTLTPLLRLLANRHTDSQRSQPPTSHSAHLTAFPCTYRRARHKAEQCSTLQCSAAHRATDSRVAACLRP